MYTWQFDMFFCIFVMEHFANGVNGTVYAVVHLKFVFMIILDTRLSII